jgi:hypothetical protein
MDLLKIAIQCRVFIQVWDDHTNNIDLWNIYYFFLAGDLGLFLVCLTDCEYQEEKKQEIAEIYGLWHLFITGTGVC